MSADVALERLAGDVELLTRRRTVGRVEAELRHSEAIIEGYRLLALAELELERYGDALAEDDRRRLVDLARTYR